MKWSVRWMWKFLSVLCLFWSLPGEGFVIKPLNPEVLKNLELLSFVLHNNEAWDYVLNQNIKITHENRPFYQDATEDEIDPEIKTKLHLIEGTEFMISPLPIIKRVLDNFGWLGSYIEFAVFVLHKAFMCTTFEFLQLQIEIIALMEEKSVWKTDKDKPLLKAWESVVQFIAKVTALNGNLEILTDLSFVYTEFMLEHPERANYVLRLMANEIEKTVNDQCNKTDQKMILKEFGVIITIEYLHGLAINYDQIKNIFNRVISGMITMFGELNIQSISMKNWSQILNFKTAVEEHINLNLKIDKILENDEIGRNILKERKAKIDEKIRQLSENPDDKLVFEGGSEEVVEEK